MRPRYEHRAGFVSAPGHWFDCSPQELLRVAPASVGVIQRLLTIPNYDKSLSLEMRARNFGLIEEAASALAFSRCDVIGQTGSSWVHLNGQTPEEIEAYCDALGQRLEVKFYMAGFSVVRALREIGAKRITLSFGYYRPQWAVGMNLFLEQAGFDIRYNGNMVDQGIFPDFDATARAEQDTCFDYPAEIVARSLLAAHEAVPDADTIVLMGAGNRTLDCIDAVEGITGKTIVGSDNALYWEMLRGFGLAPKGRGFGSLLNSLRA